jgi:DNA-binding CsgD family transcriptional regulator
VADRVRGIFQGILASRKPFSNLENTNIHKDGRLVVLETNGVPIFDADGDLKGYRGIDRDITARKEAEEALREKEAELRVKAENLEDVNTALRVLLKEREKDKTGIEEKTLASVKSLILPYLEKLRNTRLNNIQMSCVDILESNLKNIIAPFSQKLSSKYRSFTPTEIMVANLVKEGKTTKEIAEFMNLSHKTIQSHRDNIRKKLGINKRPVNLRSYLLSP